MSKHYCGRLLVGLGDDTWDPICLLPVGHDGPCTIARCCANPACGRVLSVDRVMKKGATTCDDSCRAAAWKARTGYGRPDRPRRVRTARRGGPSGLQISYRKAVDLVSAFLNGNSTWRPDRCDEIAESVLRGALSEKQRARLEARDQ